MDTSVVHYCLRKQNKFHASALFLSPGVSGRSSFVGVVALFFCGPFFSQFSTHLQRLPLDVYFFVRRPLFQC